MTFCVYALVGGAAARARRPAARGVTGEPLQTVGGGAVAAVVGPHARAPKPAPDLLRRYDGTITALMSQFPALLPVRFGTCMSLDELEFVLRSRRGPLQQALRHVRNRVQMTVRIIGAGEASGGSGARGVGEAGSGRSYLHARAEEARRERAVAGFDPVRAAVRRWVRDERVERRAGVASVYHLVPRTAADRYRTALERAASAAGLQAVVTGPWAPYAFTTW